MQLNASRIKVLQAQDDLVSSMKEAASKELLHVSHDHHVYKRLLRDLVVQVSIDSADLPNFILYNFDIRIIFVVGMTNVLQHSEIDGISFLCCIDHVHLGVVLSVVYDSRYIFENFFQGELQ